MSNMTLSVPKEMKEKMDAFGEINWSVVAREAIMRKVDDLETMEKIANKSKLTEKDVQELSKKINRNIAKNAE